MYALGDEHSQQGGKRQRVELACSSLKRVFGIGETLALLPLWAREQDRGKDLRLRLLFLDNRHPELS